MLLEKFMGSALAQDDIGWGNMLEGWVARAWRDIQENILWRKNFTGQRLVGLRGWWKGCWKWLTQSGSIVATLCMNRKKLVYRLIIITGLRDIFSYIRQRAKKI